MPTILVAGPSRSGKTSLAAGLLVWLRDAGYTAAYVKPFSASADSDADHEFAANVLAGALDITVGPAPLPLSGSADEAAGSVASMAESGRAVIVEVADGSPATEITNAIDARVLEIHGYAPNRDWAQVVDTAAVRWGTRLAWVVINSVPAYRQDAVRDSAAQSSADVDAVVIPESRVMLAPTVAQVAAHLGADWVQEPVNEEAPVERFLIGGNIMDNGPTYYGRYANQAVITRAQRPDIQLACMLAQTRCLVLTGPGEATNYIRAEALERDIPLLRVPTSTIETADALDRLIDASTAHSLAKARHFAALLEQRLGSEALDSWLA